MDSGIGLPNEIPGTPGRMLVETQDAGVHELVFDPTVARLDQVELLAEATL